MPNRRVSSPLLLPCVSPLLLLCGTGTSSRLRLCHATRGEHLEEKLTAILPVSLVAVLTVKFSRVPRFLLNAERVAPKSWLDSKLNSRANNVSTHQR